MGSTKLSLSSLFFFLKKLLSVKVRSENSAGLS